jgi:hypothetical protein
MAEHSLTKKLGIEWISQVFTDTDILPDHAIPGLSSYFEALK